MRKRREGYTLLYHTRARRCAGNQFALGKGRGNTGKVKKMRKGNWQELFFHTFFPFRIESQRNRVKRKTKKNFRKSLVVKNKALTFAPAFKTKAASSLKY